MPRPNAYAICITETVRKRIINLLECAEKSACEDHSGPNLKGSLYIVKQLLLNKKLHKHIR